MAKNSCQKKPNFSEILGIKVVQFWCYTKSVKRKTVPLNWYSSKKIFFERFGSFLTLKIDFENQILALFDGYFWPFNKSHEKIKSIFVISAIIPSIWNVFIKFRWHDEKLTTVLNLDRQFFAYWGSVQIYFQVDFLTVKKYVGTALPLSFLVCFLLAINC